MLSTADPTADFLGSPSVSHAGKSSWADGFAGVKRSGRSTGSQGQAMIEIALIGTIVAIVLLGIFELVSMFTARSEIIDATRAGARIVSLNYADNISISRVVQALDSHHLNTITNGQCDVTEIDIYEASDRNNQPAPQPVPMQSYLLNPGTDTYGGACSTQLNTASPAPPFDQTTRNKLAIAAQGQAPATVGVRLYYRYHFHTPVLAAAGATFNFSLSSVFPLGGDNANNFQNLAVPPAPPAPLIPAAPANIWVSAPGGPTLPQLCGPPVTNITSTTGTITTTGVLTGTGTISSTTTYSPTGTISTTGSYTGQGTITSNTIYPATGTITATGTLSGEGTVTSNTIYPGTDTITSTGVLTGEGTIIGSYPSYTFTGSITTTGVLTGTGTISSTTTYAINGIKNTGSYKGQGTITSQTSYGYSGTIRTTGTLSGQGTVTSSTTYSDNPPTGNASSSVTPTGEGTMTITTNMPTTYDGTTTGYTLAWPAASSSPIAPSGYLVYFVHNGGTPTLVPGISAANPIPATDTTYPDASLPVAQQYLPSSLHIYQPPAVSPGDYWYVTSITNGKESTTPSPSSPGLQTITMGSSPATGVAAVCTPQVPPATYVPPPANFQVTTPNCVAGQYPPALGVRMSWNPVAGASGYVLYSVHAGVPTMLGGMSLSSPWTITQYPPPGNAYDPTYNVGDYWQVYSVLNGVQSPIPATSPAVVTACQPAVNS